MFVIARFAVWRDDAISKILEIATPSTPRNDELNQIILRNSCNIRTMDNVLRSLDALLVTNPVNIRYLTGFVGLSQEERESYVLLTTDKMYLFTNSLYIESARSLTAHPSTGEPTTKYNKIEIFEISREKPIEKEIGRILDSVYSEQRRRIRTILLGFETNDVTIAEYEQLKTVLKHVKLIATKDRIELLRRIKRPDEIENIKMACKIADDCFAYIVKQIKPGVTEREIAWKMETCMREKGAQLAFSPIIAFGAHSSQPHYSPDCMAQRSRPGLEPPQGPALKKTDIALLDFGAKVNGYCSDITRVVFVGKPKREWTRGYQTVFEAHKAALKYLNNEKSVGVNSAHTGGGLARHRRMDNSGSVPGGRADRLAREVIKKAGYPTYPHSLGHNIGLSVHEGPRLSMIGPSTGSGQTLLPGMVFSVEPGIYLPGQYGIRIEDLVLLKKDGIEVLTKSPKEIIIL